MNKGVREMEKNKNLQSEQIAEKPLNDPNDHSVFLECKGIVKQFNGIQVLKSVDLDIRHGEVHALMGENGAGKSTIIKIITGVYVRDGGDIYLDGKLTDIRTRQDSRDCGISVIYQELSLLPALTVTENIFLGQEIKGKFGLPDWKEMRRQTKELIDRYEFALDPDAVVETLGMAKRQMVEILKALAVKAKLIIMDEPTASLAAAEAEKLFETINTLRSRGAAILYISHRLEEVYRLADRLTVMRDGCNVAVLEKDEIEPKKVVELMLGHTPKGDSDYFRRPLHEENVLEVKDLHYKNLLKGINFKAVGGEILGIGGLVGSGRTELISCIYGSLKQTSGTITYNGKPVSHSILKNMKAGFGLVPEDRRNEGFIPLLSIQQNFALASYDKIAPFGVVSSRKEVELAERGIKDYDVRPPMRRLPVGNLSGGNQQKVVLGRWLARHPNVLMLDEPTAGVDVGVKADLYQYMRDLAAEGAIVIMVSSDLAELVHVSDRILVIHDGVFFEEFQHENVTQESILLASSGVHTEEGKAI